MEVKIKDYYDDEMLDFITIEEEEEIIEKMGTRPIVNMVNGNGSMYVSRHVGNLIKTDYVTISKAGKYLLFRECRNKNGFKLKRKKHETGGSISICGVLSKTGIRPEQIHGKTPKRIKDGFAIELY